MVICIEGAIGAGKTSLINTLKARNPDKYTYYPEPIEQWERPGGPLENFYADPERYAFEFELQCIWQLLRSTIGDPTEIRPKIQERSLLAVYHVFSQLQHKEGNISTGQLHIIKNVVNTYLKLSQVEAIVHIYVEPELALERIRLRGWNSESNLTEEYATQVCELYDQLYLENYHQYQVPIVYSDGNGRLETMAREVGDLVDRLGWGIQQNQLPQIN